MTTDLAKKTSLAQLRSYTVNEAIESGELVKVSFKKYQFVICENEEGDEKFLLTCESLKLIHQSNSLYDLKETIRTWADLADD